MTVTFAEYDANGDVFHICQVDHAEGPGFHPLPPDADAAARAARQAELGAAVAAAADATRDQLAAAAAQGARLHVVAKGAATVPALADPEGRWRVVGGKLTRRSDAELATWRAARGPVGPPASPPAAKP